jgi:hypothetical protein
MGNFMKYSHSKAMAVFYKIVKLAKNGVLMIIHIIDETIESDLPYLCDIQLFENIKNANLLAHIERMGFVFYGGDK